MPKVSIVAGCYNHEKYISRFIESVLKQSFTDFELIIIDDCSIDKSVFIINKYEDPRIKLITHNFNMGPSISANDGIKASQGKYISFMSTDDELKKDYLSSAISFLEKNKKYDLLCFTPQIINEDSQPIKDHWQYKKINHLDIIKKMFLVGNVLPIIGQVIRKEALLDMTFKSELLQTQDYDFQVNLLLKNKIPYLYKKRLVNYRVSNNGNNIDNHSDISNLRYRIELRSVLNNFLKINFEMFKKIFKGEIKKTKFKPYPQTVSFVLGLLALNTPDSNRQRWGYETILNFISSKKNIFLIDKLYNLEYKDIVSFSKKIDILKEDLLSQKMDILNNKMRILENSKIYKIKKIFH